MKRYALVGCGVRGISMYARPIVKYYGDSAELVAICDTNSKRMDALNRYCDADAPNVHQTSMQMLADARPDAVDRHLTRLDAPRRDHPCAGGRLRRHHREADDDRRGEVPRRSSTRRSGPAAR